MGVNGQLHGCELTVSWHIADVCAALHTHTQTHQPQNPQTSDTKRHPPLVKTTAVTTTQHARPAPTTLNAATTALVSTTTPRTSVLSNTVASLVHSFGAVTRAVGAAALPRPLRRLLAGVCEGVCVCTCVYVCVSHYTSIAHIQITIIHTFTMFLTPCSPSPSHLLPLPPPTPCHTGTSNETSRVASESAVGSSDTEDEAGGKTDDKNQLRRDMMLGVFVFLCVCVYIYNPHTTHNHAYDQHQPHHISHHTTPHIPLGRMVQLLSASHGGPLPPASLPLVTEQLQAAGLLPRWVAACLTHKPALFDKAFALLFKDVGGGNCVVVVVLCVLHGAAWVLSCVLFGVSPCVGIPGILHLQIPACTGHPHNTHPNTCWHTKTHHTHTTHTLGKHLTTHRRWIMHSLLYKQVLLLEASLHTCGGWRV